MVAEGLTVNRSKIEVAVIVGAILLAVALIWLFGYDHGGR